MTFSQRLARIKCWLRYYHRNSPAIGRFRYDCSGMCCDCGKVGTGVQGPDGE